MCIYIHVLSLLDFCLQYHPSRSSQSTELGSLQPDDVLPIHEREKISKELTATTDAG